MLGWDGRKLPFGTVFNMSAGYNLDGIKTPRMQKFMNTLSDASEHVEKYMAILGREFPRLADIEVPNRLTESVALSTMHGCPPKRSRK